VEIDPRLLRVGEIYDARADAAQARRDLGWKPNVEFPTLVRMMLRADLRAVAS
jgi:GDPmannose 4,6-dehydratase